ncbi:hypothetical protein AVEN_151779-1 [Araneus ventricosus]|uniref:Uncharacterized protein n=1 Tax=Araneus ventricosus TaxID=182803 RepID=A0A4Y2VCM2_ARAVE|nr:hypothetical protein AVEN_151779-1 [Araneus ventricosus]
MKNGVEQAKKMQKLKCDRNSASARERACFTKAETTKWLTVSVGGSRSWKNLGQGGPYGNPGRRRRNSLGDRLPVCAVDAIRPVNDPQNCMGCDVLKT